MRNLWPIVERVDRVLTERGVLPLSDRWRAELQGFYESGARVHVARVGRGGSKSTTSVKSIVAEVLGGEWSVPRGERHWAIFVSENLDEVRARLGQVEAYLSALEVPFERSGEQILLADLPLGFWVRAARIGAVSGPRVVAWSVDEAAKLSVDGVNPAAELIASLKAASVTHPEARGRVYSSPWSSFDVHYDLVEAGTNPPHTYVSTGATWEFAPWLTEAQTRALEPEERVWRREYLAEPQAAISSAFSLELIEPAFRAIDRNSRKLGRSVLIVDPSSGRGDSWAFAVALWIRPPTPEAAFERVDLPGYTLLTETQLQSYRAAGLTPPPDPRPFKRNEWGDVIVRPDYQGADLATLLALVAVDGFDGRFGDSMPLDSLVVSMLRKLQRAGYSPTVAVGDQREAFALEAEFRRHGIEYNSIAWTAPNKVDAVARVRRLLSDRRLVVEGPKAEVMRKQLAGFSEKITPSGSITYGARTGHDDYAALTLTAALADLNGLIGGSPLARPRGRGPGGSIEARQTA